MTNSYYYYYKGQWYWWSGWGWSKPNDGRRYPVVNIVILTLDSFKYVVGGETITEPPQDSSPDTVTLIEDMKTWEEHWNKAAPLNKLLVFEFFEKNSSLCKAMETPFEGLAKKYKGKAEFYKLDVDNLEFLARICGVEGAYPTFALFKNGRQVGKVVGLKEDELDRSIQRELN